MNKLVSAALIASVTFSVPAYAGPKYVLQPIQLADESVRFEQGVPTVDQRKTKGAVQITPLPDDHGNMSFGVIALNDGQVPANIDISNIRVEGIQSKKPTRLLSREEMEKKAKSRAAWQTMALALAGATAAAAAASQRDYYTHTMTTPRGTYRSVFSAPSQAGQAQAAVLAAGTGVGIYAVQNQLDKTRQMLANEALQMTTIDPGDSYGGRIYLTRFKPADVKGQMRLVVNFNGEDHVFAFRYAKAGTPLPQYRMPEAPSPVAAGAAAPVAASTAAPTT